MTGPDQFPREGYIHRRRAGCLFMPENRVGPQSEGLQEGPRSSATTQGKLRRNLGPCLPVVADSQTESYRCPLMTTLTTKAANAAKRTRGTAATLVPPRRIPHPLDRHLRLPNLIGALPLSHTALPPFRQTQRTMIAIISA